MQPGDVIDGKYRVEAQLGEGGMGVVIAATHLHLENTVAIKILKLEALKHKEAALRFKREAKAASRLRSEHVVKVSDVGQLPSGAPYMVMEMLYGEDVATQLKRGPLPVSAAVEYIIQACEGLAEAHGLGMIHRDVKPANLFVTRRPNGAPLVKLVDFGIATAAYGEIDHRLTTTQSVMGSPTYMSPEQLRAARDVDARSDIWSLGITLFEMLSGRQPFEGPTLTALTLKIVGDAHPRIPGASPELHMVLDRCLAKEREARFANVGELAQALAPFLDHGEIAASMVVGALSQGVAPTLHGLENSSPAFSSVRSSPSTQFPPPQYGHSTTNIGNGQTGSRLDLNKRSRGVWIGLGAAALVASVAIALIVRSTTSSGTPSANASPTPSESPKVEPPPPPPKPQPTAEPIIDTQHLVDQKKEEPPPAPAPPPVKTVAKKSPSRGTSQRKNSGSNGNPQDPYKGSDSKEPKKEPEKQPCLPSDPKCGL